MKGENSRTTSCLLRRGVTRSHRKYSTLPSAGASPLADCLYLDRSRILRLSEAQPDGVGHAFLAALPPRPFLCCRQLWRVYLVEQVEGR